MPLRLLRFRKTIDRPAIGGRLRQRCAERLRRFLRLAVTQGQARKNARHLQVTLQAHPLDASVELAEIIADGTYAKIFAKYFGAPPAAAAPASAASK